MTACDFNESQLLAWMDGEAASKSFVVQTHLDACLACVARIERVRRTRHTVADLIDRGVGAVEPLLALQQIRHQIHHAQSRALPRRLVASMLDMWRYNRTGLLLSIALILLCVWAAPYVTQNIRPLWPQGSGDSSNVNPVTVESLVVQDNAHASVIHGDRKTTLIWVEPNAPQTPGAPKHATPKTPAPRLPPP